MKVKLKNVGMLDEAEFEVGDLTLICGENNTGKTYATYSLYGYLDFMQNVRLSEISLENSTRMLENATRMLMGAREMRMVDLRKYDENEILDNIDKNRTILSYETFKEELEKYIAKKSKGYTELYISDMLASKEEDFKESEMSVDINITIDIIKQSLKNIINAQIDLNQKIFDIVIQENSIEIRFLRSFREDKRYILEHLYRLYDLILVLLLPKKFILSVERTGASIFQGELDFRNLAEYQIIKKMAKGERIGFFEMQEKLNERTQVYPKPVRDNIDFIRNIKQISKQDSIFKKEKDLYKSVFDILGQILGGKYKVADSGILFQPKGNKNSFSVEIASSSVRSLLMLNYYVLNVAQRGDISKG